mmetsp:Transcript_5053/g.7374  ORF Transcript_5053/g.7374 Transcript_5053/m.7374 type:complete len:213 (-) Transcript_5053:125-763(-)
MFISRLIITTSNINILHTFFHIHVTFQLIQIMFQSIPNNQIILLYLSFFFFFFLLLIHISSTQNKSKLILTRRCFTRILRYNTSNITHFFRRRRRRIILHHHLIQTIISRFTCQYQIITFLQPLFKIFQNITKIINIFPLLTTTTTNSRLSIHAYFSSLIGNVNIRIWFDIGSFFSDGGSVGSTYLIFFIMFFILFFKFNQPIFSFTYWSNW